MKLKIICLLIIFFSYKSAYAENEILYNEIIDNLRCLVCQNQSLAESNSNLAKDLRLKVKKMLREGKSKKDIYKFMSDRYTDYVLYEPPVKKSTWFLWYSPFLILLVSISYLFFVFKKKKIKNNINLNIDEDNKINNNNKKINIRYIYIFLFIFVPIFSIGIYSYSSELMRYKIYNFFESKEPIIDITISIHDDIISKITGNEILFVYARRSNGMRLPLAINIFDVYKAKKNYNIKLDNTMSMIKNQTLSSAKEIVVEARISKHKKAMAMPGDFIGSSDPFEIKSSNYLLLKINSIVTEE